MLVKLDIQDGGILKAKTNRILDIGHSHEAAVMVGHILDGGGEVMRLQRVIAHKSEMKEDLAYCRVTLIFWANLLSILKS